MSVINIMRVPPATIPMFDIRNGRTVYGSTWSVAADMINHLTARGSMLVCGNQPTLPIAAGTTGTLRYYAWPRGIHTRRVWVLYMSAVAGGAAKIASLTVGAGGSHPIKVRVPVTALTGESWFKLENPPPPVFYVEPYTATTTPGEISLAVSASGAASAAIQRVLCFDVPRTRIEVDNGEDAAGETARGFAIYQSDERGLYGLAQAAHAGRDNFIRSNMHWFNATGFSTLSASYVPVFNLPPKCLGRAMATTDGATVTVTVAARMHATGGATAELRVTAASGATVTLSTASASAVWVTGSLAIDREDIANADAGGQIGRLFGDTLTFEARVTGDEFSTAVVTGIAVGEPL